ncbi:hypothetical protein BSKO_03650 [Bryopsis sp. KO-2023]|nr:hypothetical protein BSKO_03650 [Bryopsis sp. KO-2023]
MDEFQDVLAACDFAPPETRDCSRCNRPKRVCLCSCLPAERLRLEGRFILLQHPFEERRRLATVPIASAALENFEIIKGRSFGPQKSEALRQLVEDAQKGLCVLYVLFPGPGAVPLAQAIEEQKRKLDPGNESSDQMKDYGLIVIDGTWKEAKEIFKASSSWWLPPHGPGIRVEVSKHSSTRREGVLRMEPWEGCMSTVEAIAGALRLLESYGQRIHDALVTPFHKMVDIQCQHNEALVARRNGDMPVVVSTKKRLGTGALPKTEDCEDFFVRVRSDG